MDPQYPASFLSKQVYRMVHGIGETNLTISCTNHVFIKDNFTFKWEVLENFLCISESFSIHREDTQWFIDKVDKLWPCFIEAHSFLTSSSCTPNVKNFCEWTSHPEAVEDYLNLFCHSDVSITEALLFLTAELERSLGNLFLLKGKTVPFLLRDLLSTPEISLILGDIPIVFLQILMGTPKALNLRNIAWHGFPKPDELYPHFVSTLFVMLFSIGEILNEKGVDIVSIPKRPQMHIMTNVSSDICCNIAQYWAEIVILFSHSNIIPISHFPYWKQALDYYKNERLGRALLLLLPQFEHMLRCLFCNVNNCPERTLTAESDTLYITLNEILSTSLVDEDANHKENQFISLVGESVIEMLQDLFSHPAGPRIRDKVSHGECNLQKIPRWVVSQLIFIALVLHMKTDKLFRSKICEETSSELRNYINTAHKNYRSKFHVSSLLQNSIQQSSISLNKWSIFYSEDFYKSRQVERIEHDDSKLLSKLNLVQNCLNSCGSCLMTENLSDFVASLKVKTVFRHKSENELLTLLQQIMENIKQICDQVVESVEEKFKQYSLHLLRSRQRETFHRMIQFVPKLKDVLLCVIYIVILCLQSVNDVTKLSTKEYGCLLKFCRAILQFVQNVVSCTKSNKNRWMEIEIMAMQFCCIVIESWRAPFLKQLFYQNRPENKIH